MEIDIENKITLLIHDKVDFEWISEYGLHYKILYILDGSGRTSLNGSAYDYEKGGFFIVAPMQQLLIHPTERTRILTILLTNVTSNMTNAKVQPDGFNYLFKYFWKNSGSARFNQGKQLKDDDDRLIAATLTDILSKEVIQTKSFSKEILANCIATLIMILCRNLYNQHEAELPDQFDPKTEKLLEAVRYRVQDLKIIAIKDIAADMNITYYQLSRAVIKGTGATLKSFVTKFQQEEYQETCFGT